MWLNHRKCRQLFRYQIRTSTICRENLFPMDPARGKWEQFKKTQPASDRWCWNLLCTQFYKSDFFTVSLRDATSSFRHFLGSSHWIWQIPPTWLIIPKCLWKSESTGLCIIGILRFKDFCQDLSCSHCQETQPYIQHSCEDCSNLCHCNFSDF